MYLAPHYAFGGISVGSLHLFHKLRSPFQGDGLNKPRKWLAIKHRFPVYISQQSNTLTAFLSPHVP